MMKQNESSTDRILRAIMAVVVFIVGYVWLGGVWQATFYIIGIVLLVTAIIGFCGLYAIFGISTKK